MKRSLPLLIIAAVLVAAVALTWILLRSAWGMPFGLPATEWMLEMGALVLRTETELILKSRRVIPTRLLQSGFDFQFPTWTDAARDLCARSREKSNGLRGAA